MDLGEGRFCASPILAELAGTLQVVTVTTDSVVGVSFPEVACCGVTRGTVAPGDPTPALHGNTVIVSGHNLGTAAFNVIHTDGG